MYRVPFRTSFDFGRPILTCMRERPLMRHAMQRLTRLRNHRCCFLDCRACFLDEERQDGGNYDRCDADASAPGKDVDGKLPARFEFLQEPAERWRGECTHDEHQEINRSS